MGQTREFRVFSPETEQLCLDEEGGWWRAVVSARDELVRHFGAKPWACHITGTDRYGRLLAACTADGNDTQEWMVRNG